VTSTRKTPGDANISAEETRIKNRLRKQKSRAVQKLNQFKNGEACKGSPHKTADQRTPIPDNFLTDAEVKRKILNAFLLKLDGGGYTAKDLAGIVGKILCEPTQEVEDEETFDYEPFSVKTDADNPA